MERRFFGIGDGWFKLGAAGVLMALAAFAVARMHHNYTVIDPPQPDLTGTAAYGHNSEGSFPSFAVLALVELFVLLAVLIPFSFSRLYWMRVLILLILSVLWFVPMAVSGMHAGGVHATHTLYLFGVNVFLFVLLVASIAAEIFNARRTRP